LAALDLPEPAVIPDLARVDAPFVQAPSPKQICLPTFSLAVTIFTRHRLAKSRFLTLCNRLNL
jgi:hypothetical protein